MRRSTFPDSGRRGRHPQSRKGGCGLLLSLLLQCGGLSAAQVAPVTAPVTTPLPVGLPTAPTPLPGPGTEVPSASCGAPDALLNVMVGAADRGDQIVKLAQQDGVSSVLVPTSVFLPSEQNLLRGTLVCDGVAYALPAPGVRVRYIESTQTVRITPVLDLLGSHLLDLRALRVTGGTEPLIPAYGVSFGAAGSAAYGQNPFSAAGSAYLGAGGVRGHFGAYAGVLLNAGGGEMTFGVRALAQYLVNPGLAFYAAVNADPLLSEPGFGSTTFSGVAVAAQGGFERVAPDLRVDLPLEADVELYVSSRLTRSFHAAPGVLTIRNVPLQQFGSTLITLYITDESGTRVVERDVQLPYESLPPGAYLASARAGADRDSGFSASGSLQLGLAHGWSILAQGSYSAGHYALLGQGLYHSALWDYSLAAQAFGVGGDTQYLLSLGAGRVLGGLSLVGALQVPLNGAQVNGSTVPQFGLSASYTAPQLLVIGTGVVGLLDDRDGQRPWMLSVSSTFFPVQGSSLTLAGSLRPGAWQVGVSAGLRLNSRLQLLTGGTSVTSAGTQQQNAFAALQYTPDAQQTALFTAGTNLLAASYLNTGRIYVAAAADTQSATGQVTGAVVLVDGQPRVQQTLAQRAVLVRTGVPRVTLLLDNTPVAVTDASGDALIVNLPLGQTSTLAVDLQHLPLGVTVGERTREIVPPLSGVLVVDWRGNFKVYRFVQYFWRAGERAVNADVMVNGEKVLLDDEGYGLTPSLPAAVDATLTSEDGERQCRVSILPSSESVTCQP